MCRTKNKEDKYFPQIYLEECQYQEKKAKQKKRQIEGKIVIPESDKTDESDDKSTEVVSIISSNY